MKVGIVGAAMGLALLTAACGTDETQRAATGGLTGAGVGALVGGPIGAVIGAAAGAGGGSMMPEGADQVAINALNKEHAMGRTALNNVGLGGSSQVASATVNEAQQELKQAGLYQGPIDGIMGPETRHALAEYQQKNGLRQTATLDEQTLRRMNLATGNLAASRSEPQATSGSSMPPGGQIMSPDQIRNRLVSDGYSNVGDIRRWGDHDYTARAQQNGRTYTVEVDGQSGRILSQQ